MTKLLALVVIALAIIAIAHVTGLSHMINPDMFALNTSCSSIICH